MKYCAYMGSILVDNKFTFRLLDMNIYTTNRYSFLGDSTLQNINYVSRELSRGELLVQSFCEVHKRARRGDFVFLDPPYAEDNVDYQFNYNKSESLDTSFFTSLINFVKNLDKKGVSWLMTQADTKHVRGLFRQYKITSFPVYRRQSKSYKNELLIRNY